MNRFASAPWPYRAVYLTTLALGALALMLMITGLVALVGLKRLTTHLNPAAVPAWFWYYRADLQVRRWVAVGALVAVGAAGLVALAIGRRMRPPLHGAARWASEAELRREGLRAERGIVLGRKGGSLLTFGGSEHVMLYAPTRTGKGVGVVIPNLLTWPDSVVVLDVKRENWQASAGFRAAHGQEVFLFNPLDPDGRTARFNPLGHIDRADPVVAVDELQKLAVMLFPSPPNADPFWAEAARTGFIGVGAYVAQTPELPFSLAMIYRELTREDPRTRLPTMVQKRSRSERPLSVACANAIADFCSASVNTFASIKQTITSRMNLWLNPRVCAATDASDFDLRQLRSKRISLYLAVTPDNLLRVAPLYNLLLQQLIDQNVRELPTADQHKVPVLIVLDEFARLGHAGVIAHAFSYVAGYGLRLLLVLQSPAQLRAEYGPDLAEEIMANCGVEIAFAPKELKVAHDLSDRLGYWTYTGRSSSRPALLSKGNRSTTESDQRRALMMPQELIQMASNKLVVLRAGIRPVRADKVVFWRERAFSRRVSPPPTIPVHPGFQAVGKQSLGAFSPAPSASPAHEEPLTSERIISALRCAGLEPLPEEGASVEAVEAWVERFIDASAGAPLRESSHGR